MDPLNAQGYELSVANVAWVLTSNASEATRGARALQDCVGNMAAVAHGDRDGSHALEGPRHFIAVGEGRDACSRSFRVSGGGTWLRTIGWVWPDSAAAAVAAPVLEGGVSPTAVELQQCATATNDLVVATRESRYCQGKAHTASLGFGYAFETGA
jgi:hypothetical protein